VVTARNLMRAVDKARTLTPDVFFAALGFPQLGLENVRNLLHHVHWRELVTEPAAHFTRLEQQRVITSARRELLISQFERGQDLLDELLACVSIKDAEHAVTGRYFSGKNVVFTGVLEDMDRGVAQELVRAQGGLTPSSVTKRTHVLVVGNLAPGEQTIKLEKAKKYGVEIMDGEAFACALAENT
jgi:NAD-dependent DNA ligase